MMLLNSNIHLRALPDEILPKLFRINMFPYSEA